VSLLSTPGLHHVTLVSADVERTTAFYRDLLGLHLVARTDDEEGIPRLYFGDSAGTPGTLLEFLAWPDAAHGNPGIGGVHHVALGVEGDEAQLRWKRRLIDHGVPVSGPYDRRWFHSIYFRDPDGQILEIATRGPGYALDEPADALGTQVVVPGPESLAGERDEVAIQAATWPEPVPAIDTGMQLDGIHHVSAITGDVEAAHRFYSSALGLRLVKKTVNQDAPSMPHWFWASYDGRTVAPHSSFTLFGFPANGRTARVGTGQAHRVAFRARDEDQLLAWRDHLQELGAPVSAPADRGSHRSVYFRAPDGQLLELATDGPGFAR